MPWHYASRPLSERPPVVRHRVYRSGHPALCGASWAVVTAAADSPEYSTAPDCAQCVTAAERDTRKRYGID